MKIQKLTGKDKSELLKYNISRFDYYYGSLNIKSSFFVIGNITLLGVVLTNQSKLNDYLLYIHLLLLSTSLISVLLAIRPYLKSSKKNNNIISFVEISNLTKEEYITKIKLLTERKYIKDLTEQTYFLAKGLHRKFIYLNFATISFILAVVLLFIEIGFFL